MYTVTKTGYTRQVVHMGAGEWSSQEDGNIMRRIACDTFRHTKADIVEVVEHGGWWLIYGLIDGNITIVGTANDCARMGESIKDFWRNLAARGKETYLLEIRRP